MFYAVDTARRTAREVWWWQRSPLVVISYLQWLLRRRVMCSVDVPAVASLRPFAVDAAAVPDEARAALADWVGELEGLGFRDPAWHVIDDDLLHTRTVQATFSHPSGEAFARVQHGRWSFLSPPRTTRFAEVVSTCDDGSMLWTQGTRQGLEPTPDCDTAYVADATPTALWTIHRDRVTRGRFARAVTPLRDRAAVADAAERLHARVCAPLVARGLYRPRTDDETRRAAALTARRVSTSDAGQHADVLAEIDRLERPQTSWRKAVLVLLVSVGLFLAAGAWQWSLEYAALLVPVLLFHELGHWVAMRTFHYRNLHMFFIPFFGAAVSGRHYNVPGWKRVVVSLMGPVPGIVAGAALTAVALLTESDLARRLALVALIVNAINLAPVLPLDGGWVVRSLVFARHHLLDVAFALLAGAALLRLGVANEEPLLGLIGLVFLLSALTTYRTGLIVRALRGAALAPLPADDDRIPAATAAVIVERVRGVWPKANARAHAQHVLRVFEALNARPPGWLATLGLGTVYLGSIALALAAGYALTVGDRLLRPYLEPAARVDSAAVIAPPDGAFPADGHALLIATFDDPTAARAAHAALAAAPVADATAGLFGQSVILSAPSGAVAQTSVARLSDAGDLLPAARAADVQISLTCHTADAASAAALHDTLAQFFRLPTERLIPPWADPDPRPASERARHQWTRQAWRRIGEGGDLYDTPAMAALSEQVIDAIERDDDAALDALLARRRALERDAVARTLADLQSDGSAGTDDEFLAAYAAALAANEADETAASHDTWGPVLVQLGTVPDSAPHLARQTAMEGDPSQYGTMLRVDDLVFADVVHGPAALAAWLQAGGCGDQHYAFRSE